MYFDNADFLSSAVQVVDQLFCRIADGAHRYDDLFCVWRTIVVERLIVCADLGIDFFHIFIDDIRSFQVSRVAGFSVLEEGLRLFRRTSAVRVHRMKCVLLEPLNGVPVNHFLQVIIVPHFDLLIFVGGSESVEEMKHRQFAGDGSQMCNSSQVHNLLYAVGAQHSKTGLTASHHVGVVTEDGQCMRRQRSCCNVEYGRCLFTGQFIHIRNHQKQALGSGKGGGIGTCGDGTVYCTCSAAFGLHFYDFHFFSKDIGSVLGNPFVHALCHRGRWCNRVNRCNLREGISYMSGRGVSIHSL